MCFGGADGSFRASWSAPASAILKQKIEDLGIKVIVPATTKACMAMAGLRALELADGQVLAGRFGPGQHGSFG
jgi:NAD(P)H-nitrite reductase large subunit